MPSTWALAERMQGRYNDGLTAASHDVQVTPGDAALHLHDSAVELAVWPYADIVAQENGRFALGDARLTLFDAASVADLCARLPRRRIVVPWRLLGLVAAAIAVVALFFWQGLPLFARQVAAVVPERVEVRTGHTVRAAMVREIGKGRVCVFSPGQVMLNLLRDNLAKAGPPPRLPHTITVIDAGMINAFALPGGQIVLFRGLIDFLQHPNELAGILAHEMGHSDLRHPLETFVKRATGAFAIGLLFGDIVGFSVIAAAGEALLTGAYTREAERAADAFAIDRLRAAGISTVQVADFFTRMEARSGLLRGLPGHFSTHPSDAERAAAMRADSSGHAALSDAQWRDIKAICSRTEATSSAR